MSYRAYVCSTKLRIGGSECKAPWESSGAMGWEASECLAFAISSLSAPFSPLPSPHLLFPLPSFRLQRDPIRRSPGINNLGRSLAGWLRRGADINLKYQIIRLISCSFLSRHGNAARLDGREISDARTSRITMQNLFQEHRVCSKTIVL